MSYGTAVELEARTRDGPGFGVSPTQRVAAIALVFTASSLAAATANLLVSPGSREPILAFQCAVLTAALMLAPVRSWWLVILAAASGGTWPQIVSGVPLSAAALGEAANLACAAVAAGGLRLLRVPKCPGTVRDVTGFLAFVGLLGPAAGALVGASDLLLDGRSAEFWRAWPSLIPSSALTGVTILPAILLFARRGASWLQPSSVMRLIEASLLVVGLAVAVVYAFAEPTGSDAIPMYLYGPLALLFWAAVRFGTPGTIGAVTTVAALMIAQWETGRGYFASGSPAAGELHLQLFLIAVSVPALLLSALVQQLIQTATELRQGQNRYRSVVEDQTELICRFLPDGTYTFVNGAYCRYFGRSPEDLLGRSFWMFLPEAARELVRDSLESITADSPVATAEHEVIGPGGELRLHLWTNRGLFDGSGRLVEYQAVGRDVTQRKRAEEEHQQLESQRRIEETLRDADRRKDEFLAMLAHELRNPLAPIGLAVETLRREPLSEESREARDIIARQVVHITRLVDDLLDISRITLGKIRLNFESVNLGVVVRQAVDGARPLMEASRHHLSVSMPQVPVHANADPARLTQVIANLLDNAAKYTDPGGRISLIVEREGSDVLLTVSDEGIGIAADKLPTIFEPFTQVRSSLSAVHGGLGIGLTLVRRLVELHGGRVAARSAGLGQGSEFVVRLPALAVAVAEQLPSPEPDALEPIPLRVLVVDDNVDAANSLARLLRVTGHTVHVANDGEAALESEREFGPDAVLLDLALPRMDGLEVARRLRRRYESEPLLIVALTGFGQPADRERTAAAGFDHHFTKPVGIETVEALLSRWALSQGKGPEPKPKPRRPTYPGGRVLRA